MSAFVLDASVVLKWFVPEVHSDAARRLLDAPHQYLAPDLLFPEAGNAIWKKVRRGELTADEAERLVADLSTVAVETVATRGLVADAYRRRNWTNGVRRDVSCAGRSARYPVDHGRRQA